MPQKEKKNPSLEEQFEKLEQLIDILSDEEVSLEEAFSAYSKGMELLKNCQDAAILDTCHFELNTI